MNDEERKQKHLARMQRFLDMQITILIIEIVLRIALIIAIIYIIIKVLQRLGIL